ncbi:MAG: hypothetical protein KAI66_27905, partial [Lentisphaeria bacterium]|nr:hypothetical protein [Lentisphaeria bacterium]
KKVPVQRQDYSSQSYHASVETELPDGLDQRQLQNRIHETFALVRESVEAELHGDSVHAPVQSQPKPLPTSQPRRASNASPKQILYLMDLAVKQGMDKQALNVEALRLFNVLDIDQLSRKQASDLIDMLNGGKSQRRAA